MAKLAKTVTIGIVSTNFTPPDDKDFLVRMENLDGTDSCWINLIGGTAAAEADECIRIDPGQSYYARYMASYEGISTGVALQLLLDSGNGRG